MYLALALWPKTTHTVTTMAVTIWERRTGKVEKPGMVHDQRAPVAQDERNQNCFAKFVSASGGKVDAFATKPSPQPLTNFRSRIIQNDMGVNQEIIPK